MPSTKICSISGCGKTVLSRGWCPNHYSRWRKYGNPTGGKDGTRHGAPLEYLETVVLPYDGDECLMWPFSKGAYKYGYIYVNKKTTAVSREVCRRIHGEPPTPEHEAAHGCGRGAEGCVTPRHLRWATPVENAADKIAHGTKLLGSRIPYAKLKEDQVLTIMRERGTTSAINLGKRYNVTSNAIYRIWYGHNWSWLTSSIEQAQRQ